MDSKKKVLIAIILIIILSLTVYSFAASDDEEELSGNDKTQQVEKKTTDDKKSDDDAEDEEESEDEETEDEESEESNATSTDKAYAKALKLLKQAEASLTKEDLEKAREAISKVTKTNTDKLTERLNKVANDINVEELVKNLEQLLSDAKDQEDIQNAGKYNTDNELASKVSTVNNANLKQTLTDKLNELVNIINDQTAPEVNITNDSYSNKDITIEAKDDTKLSILLNGKEVSNNSTVSEEGTYELTITDAAFNTTTVKFTIDKTAPEIVLKKKKANKVVEPGNYKVNLVAEVTDTNLDTTTLNGVDYVSGTVIKKTNDYTLVATDKAGNESKIEFVIDKVKPVIQLNDDEFTGKYSTAVYYNKNVVLNVSDAYLKETKVYEYEGDYSLIWGEFGFTNELEYTDGMTFTEEGLYLVEVKDMAGNISKQVFEIDTTPMALTDYEAVIYSKFTDFNNAKVKNSQYATNGDTLGVFLEFDEWFTQAPTIEAVVGDTRVELDAEQALMFGLGYITLDDSIVLPDGEVKFVISNIVDKAGNKSADVEITLDVDKKIYLDRTSPVLSVKTESSIGTQDHYKTVDFKLYDNMGFTKVKVNGKAYDMTINTWGDLNFASWIGYVEGKNTVVLFDQAGNKTKYTFVLDTTDPVVSIDYSETDWTNEDVTATITANEKLQAVDGWTLSKNGKKLTKAFTANETGDVTVSDLAGNKVIVDYSVTNIDKENPVLTVKQDSVGTEGNYSVPNFKLYDSNAIAKVVVNGTQEFTQSSSQWGDFNYGWWISYVQGENTVTLYDVAGNTASYTFNFDTVTPEATIDYSETNWTNQDVTATITANEEIQSVDGWTLSNDQKSLEKVFSANETGSVTVKDLAGNEVVVNYSVTNIDKTAPVLTLKDNSVGTSGYYKTPNFSLYDNVGIDKVVINGTQEITQSFSKWGDLNYGGWINYVQGENTVTLYDVAGNSTSYTFIFNANLVPITNDQELYDAINNQEDGQYWVIKEGNYTLTQNNTYVYGGQTGWFFPIVKNNITIEGLGNVRITVDHLPANGAWATQDMIIIAGNNVELKNLILGGYQNKLVEILGDNAKLTNITGNAYTGTDEAGSIYINAHGITTTLTNVVLNKGRISLSGADSTNVLNMTNVVVNYAGGEYEADGFTAYNDASGATVNIKNFSIYLSSAFSGNLVSKLNMLPNGTVVNFDKGTYAIGDNAVLNKTLDLYGNGSTLTGNLIVNGTGTKFIGLGITSEWNNALVINADHVKIYGGTFITKDVAKQGEGTIRYMASATSYPLVRNATIKGGIYIDNYTGSEDTLLANIKSNNIEMEYTGTTPLVNINIRTTNSVSSDLATKLAAVNTLTHKQAAGHNVLIQNMGWTPLSSDSFGY